MNVSGLAEICKLLTLISSIITLALYAYTSLIFIDNCSLTSRHSTVRLFLSYDILILPYDKENNCSAINHQTKCRCVDTAKPKLSTLSNKNKNLCFPDIRYFSLFLFKTFHWWKLEQHTEVSWVLFYFPGL